MSTTNPIIVIIGGASRMGKSTIADNLAAATSADVLRLDALIGALKAAGVEGSYSTADTSLWRCTDKFLDRVRGRSKLTNAAAAAYALRCVSDGRSCIAEGGFWPDFTDDLRAECQEKGTPYIELYMGATACDYDEELARLKAINAADSNSWLNEYDDDDILAYCHVNTERFCRIAALAKERGLAVFDLPDFDGDISEMSTAAWDFVTSQLALKSC